MKQQSGIYLVFATVLASLLVFAMANRAFAIVKPCVGVEVHVQDENNQPVVNELVVLMAKGIGYQLGLSNIFSVNSVFLSLPV